MGIPKKTASEARQELRTAARDINFELRRLTQAVNEVRDRAQVIKETLFAEARVVRRLAKAEQSKDHPNAITVLHGLKGRSTRKGHGEQ